MLKRRETIVWIYLEATHSTIIIEEEDKHPHHGEAGHEPSHGCTPWRELVVQYHRGALSGDSKPDCHLQGDIK